MTFKTCSCPDQSIYLLSEAGPPICHGDLRRFSHSKSCLYFSEECRTRAKATCVSTGRTVPKVKPCFLQFDRIIVACFESTETLTCLDLAGVVDVDSVTVRGREEPPCEVHESRQ